MSDLTTADPATRKPRPLSPHLFIYKPLPTMVTSILHRVTGAAMYFGTVLVAWWLVATASGPDAFATASAFFGSWFGMLVLFGYSWALVFHMLGGMKHLMQDTGTGLQRDFTTALAYAHIAASIVITLVLWIAAAVLS